LIRDAGRIDRPNEWRLRLRRGAAGAGERDQAGGTGRRPFPSADPAELQAQRAWPRTRILNVPGAREPPSGAAHRSTTDTSANRAATPVELRSAAGAFCAAQSHHLKESGIKAFASLAVCLKRFSRAELTSVRSLPASYRWRSRPPLEQKSSFRILEALRRGQMF